MYRTESAQATLRASLLVNNCTAAFQSSSVKNPHFRSIRLFFIVRYLRRMTCKTCNDPSSAFEVVGKASLRSSRYAKARCLIVRPRFGESLTT
jgi:hypothetical protein